MPEEDQRASRSPADSKRIWRRCKRKEGARKRGGTTRLVLVVTVTTVSTLSGSGLAGVDGLVNGLGDNIVGGGGRGLGDESGGLLDSLVLAPVAVGSRRRGSGSLRATSERSPGDGVGHARGGDRGRSLGGKLIVVALARAKGDNDVSVVRARLHAVGIVVGVTVGLLLRAAVLGVGGDLPVAVPGVAVNLAQVVPDDAVVVSGVLILKDVLQRLRVGKLEGPAVAVRQLSVLLSVSLVRLEPHVDLLVSTAGGGDVAHPDLVVASVLDNSVTKSVGEGSAGQNGGGGNHVGDHFCFSD